MGHPAVRERIEMSKDGGGMRAVDGNILYQIDPNNRHTDEGWQGNDLSTQLGEWEGEGADHTDAIRRNIENSQKTAKRNLLWSLIDDS